MFSDNANRLAGMCAGNPTCEGTRRVLSDAIRDCGDEFADIASALIGERGEEYAKVCSYMLLESGQLPDALAFYFVVRHLVPMADKQKAESEKREKEQYELQMQILDELINGRLSSPRPTGVIRATATGINPVKLPSDTLELHVCLPCGGRPGNLNCNWCNGRGRYEV